MVENRVGVGAVLGLAWALGACSSTADEVGPAIETTVTGSAQKGPFSSGSSVRIAELDAQLVQTGRQFSAIIDDDSGSYSVRGVQLSTPYARVEVNGYYFDEVRGKLSDGPLTLLSYVDLSDQATTNVNLLGHLEAGRLEHLVVEDGLTFGDAKARAHEEVLRVFELDPTLVGLAESLDISQAGDGNAALLATSIMLQGTRPVAELSELLSKIQNDLREDGSLDDADTGAALMTGATVVNLTRTRENLIARFDELGVVAEVPAFETAIAHFAETSTFERGQGGIVYPLVPERPNFLDPTLTHFDVNPVTQYRYGSLGFAAELPDATELRIRITNHEVGHQPRSYWSHIGANVLAWQASHYDFETGVQEFSTNHAGLSDLQDFTLDGNGSATVEYFEYGSTVPTRTKEVTWTYFDPSTQP